MTLPRSMLLPSQYCPQATTNKAVDSREGKAVGMLEVAIPASQGRVERRNHVFDGVSHVTFRLGADLIAQRHQTFLTHTTLACFKPIPQKLKALSHLTTVPDMGLVRM